MHTVKTAFSVEEDPSTKSFFSEIIGSISDMKYSMDGRYIVTRDFMTMKLWDVAMERQPVKTVRIHEYLRPRLCDLYENDCIFDKFECAINHDGTFVPVFFFHHHHRDAHPHFFTPLTHHTLGDRQLISGSYSRKFKIFDVNSNDEVQMVANRIQPPRHHRSKSKKGTPTHPADESAEDVDYARKVMHVALHPSQNVLAITAQNNLFIFS